MMLSEAERGGIATRRPHRPYVLPSGPLLRKPSFGSSSELKKLRRSLVDWLYKQYSLNACQGSLHPSPSREKSVAARYFTSLLRPKRRVHFCPRSSN
eukprot:scaffold617_cov161-Pinguiococcus_pyrenoidosus.AAC.5